MAKATTMTSSAGWSDQPRQQLGRQGVQVNLVPQPDAERLDRPDGIERRLKPPIHDLLDGTAGRLEQGGHGQGGASHC